VQAIAGADVLVVNGLGLEGWMARLEQSAGYQGPVIVATEKVTPLQDEHATDPHAWQSVKNAELYVQTIAAGLAKADPAHAVDYAQNALAYTAKLQKLDAEVWAAYQGIPADKRIVITTHDAFAYYGHEYGIKFLAAEGISTEGEAKPADVASLIRQIRDKKTRAVFIENMTDPRLIQQIASEAGVKLDGELYSDALSQPDGPAATYIDMMAHNTAELSRAMRN
jgi:zinc/manganese transport system substrate-binding protein